MNEIRPAARALPTDLADRLRAALPDGTVLTEATDREAYLLEERSLYRGQAPIVLRPRSTEEVAAAVRICAEAGAPIVPQGGNTGLVGGTVTAPHEVLLSLGRMNGIEEVDPLNFTMTVQAGCILADIQAAAEHAGRLFPLSLGAQGSAQIGGNLASNAGGINVLRYGNARDLVLGLEVVLADGRVWNGLRALHKDNTGYALKHLFVGSEGTLGIITRAVLKLFPRLTDRVAAFCALRDPADALTLLSLARDRAGEAVTAFELMSGLTVEIVARHAGGHDPMRERHPWYALIELAGSGHDGTLRPVLEGILEEAFERGTLADAVIAESSARYAALWRLREGIPEAQKKEGGSIKHDVSVPVSRIPAFLHRAGEAAAEALPGVRVCAFGHLGDGNIHYNLTQPVGMEKAAFLAQWERMNAVVHDIVVELGGSISAEHGIGLLKAGELRRYKDPVEMELMHRLRDALDPARVLNPGKMLG
ncbi:FAD-binding oxidoreductase [Roseomonas populi]|uniref:FAD-binding oxidoreductase n=1 Tax=Roseomonas populi TaxID=3121582 RepID=A0ABT1XC95_9PROT|nr:FAD-binding oxidoreductase [Roseomonas pecuniae]MCR0985762.1 FAD-binding oxidoreductase [Roseomonas pecuniae]